LILNGKTPIELTVESIKKLLKKNKRLIWLFKRIWCWNEGSYEDFKGITQSIILYFWRWNGI